MCQEASGCAFEASGKGPAPQEGSFCEPAQARPMHQVCCGTSRLTVAHGAQAGLGFFWLLFSRSLQAHCHFPGLGLFLEGSRELVGARSVVGMRSLIGCLSVERPPEP